MKYMLCAAALTVVVILAGCTIYSISPNYTMKSQEESIVIGSLTLPEGGIPLINKPLQGTYSSIKINTIIAKDYREYKVNPELVGNTWRFAITLPQGKYRVTYIYWGELETSINAIFTVYDTGKTYYIGSLKVKRYPENLNRYSDYMISSFLIGYRILYVTCFIVDEFTEVMSYYKQTYPNLPQNVEKSMMVFKKDWDKSYNQFTPVKP
jgi:hypothetical protein